MTPFKKKIEALRTYVAHMQAAREVRKASAMPEPITAVITPELIEFMEGIIDLADNHTFTVDELHMIWNALAEMPTTRVTGSDIEGLKAKVQELGNRMAAT